MWCVCFLWKPALSLPSEQDRAILLIGILVVTPLTIWQNFMRVCVCTSDVVSHRMLLLSPSFTPSVHGYSRRPQISFSCLCVCVKSNRGNLSEPNSVQMYRAECDNTLPWHLSTGWTSKHTIACALPRACSCSFLSPTKACASVSHGERQPRFDNLFMGWKKKTICAWWDDRDLMFVEGATE